MKLEKLNLVLLCTSVVFYSESNAMADGYQTKVTSNIRAAMQDAPLRAASTPSTPSKNPKNKQSKQWYVINSGTFETAAVRVSDFLPKDYSKMSRSSRGFLIPILPLISNPDSRQAQILRAKINKNLHHSPAQEQYEWEKWKHYLMVDNKVQFHTRTLSCSKNTEDGVGEITINNQQALLGMTKSKETIDSKLGTSTIVTQVPVVFGKTVKCQATMQIATTQSLAAPHVEVKAAPVLNAKDKFISIDLHALGESSILSYSNIQANNPAQKTECQRLGGYLPGKIVTPVIMEVSYTHGSSTTMSIPFFENNQSVSANGQCKGVVDWPTTEGPGAEKNPFSEIAKSQE